MGRGTREGENEVRERIGNSVSSAYYADFIADESLRLDGPPIPHMNCNSVKMRHILCVY